MAVKHFHCMGPVSNNSKPTQSREPLAAIPDNQIAWNKRADGSYENVTLFEKDFSPLNALKYHEFLFDKCRESFLILYCRLSESADSNCTTDLDEREIDIASFMNFLLVTVKYHPEVLEEDNLMSSIESQLMTLRIMFHKLSFAKLPENTLAYYASYLGNDAGKPSDQLVHCHLEFRWYYIKILYELERVKAARPVQATLPEKSGASADEEVTHLISELLWISIVRYERADKSELPSFSPFSCTCVRKLWMLLMSFPLQNQDFWWHFQLILRPVLENKTPPINFVNSSLKIEAPVYFPCSNRNEWALWVIADVMRLYTGLEKKDGGLEGFNVVDDILRDFFSDEEDPQEVSMRNLLSIIARIQSASRHARSGPILILSEYFFKKINSSFAIPGCKLSTNPLSKSAKALFDLVRDKMMFSNREKWDNSFLRFLQLLGEHLMYNNANNISSSRLCSRVFLKFPTNRPEKYATFNEFGICHIAMLYLNLSLRSKNSSIAHRLVELLAAIPRSEGMKEDKHAMIWKGYGASLLALADLRADISATSSLLLDHLDWCLSQPVLGPVTQFVDALKYLFEQDFVGVKGISNLIGPWISVYFSVCRKNDIGHILTAFIPLAVNLINSTVTSEGQGLKAKLEQFIVPILSREESSTSAELAALCAILSKSCRTQLFRTWTAYEDCCVVGKFLTTILMRTAETDKFPQMSTAVQQIWARCCFSWTDEEGIKTLAKFLNETVFASDVKLEISESDPFRSFLEEFSLEYSIRETLHARSCLRTLFLSFFTKFDKMIVKLSEKLDQLNGVRISLIYDYASEMILRCGLLIYTKSDPHCLLKILLDTLFLARASYKPGHRISHGVLTAVAHSLPKLLEGLYVLGPEGDPYIARVIRELFAIYLPRLCNIPPTSHPVKLLLLQPQSRQYTFKILKDSLVHKDENNTDNILLNLKLLDGIVQSTPELSEVIFNECAETLLEVMASYGVHPNVHNACFALFSSTLNSQRNRSQMLPLLSDLCKRHIIYNAEAWCSVIRRLAPHCRVEIAPLKSIIKDLIEEIEKRRGVTSEPSLRKLLQSVELAIGIE